MARRSKHAVQHGADDNYLGLVRAFPLRPIRSYAELVRAIAMIDSLITRDDLELGEEDYIDVLSDLVHRYEAEHDPIAPVPDSRGELAVNTEGMIKLLPGYGDLRFVTKSRLIGPSAMVAQI